jgi:hypothetical protein
MSVIEKAARAVIEDATRQNPAVWMDWLTDDEETDDGKERHEWRFHSQHAPLDARDLARAVLQALREPSEEMVEAAEDGDDQGSSIYGDPFVALSHREAWTRMIDAALSE